MANRIVQECVDSRLQKDDLTKATVIRRLSSEREGDVQLRNMVCTQLIECKRARRDPVAKKNTLKLLKDIAEASTWSNSEVKIDSSFFTHVGYFFANRQWRLK